MAIGEKVKKSDSDLKASAIIWIYSLRRVQEPPKIRPRHEVCLTTTYQELESTTAFMMPAGVSKHTNRCPVAVDDLRI